MGHKKFLILLIFMVLSVQIFACDKAVPTSPEKLINFQVNHKTSLLLRVLDHMDKHKLIKISLNKIEEFLPKEKELTLNPEMKFKNKAAIHNSKENLVFRFLRHLVAPKFKKSRSATYGKFRKQIERDVTYNFIIDDKELVFMKAGENGSIRGTVSKHFLLANFKKHVRYAGEFILRKNGTFFVQNASGTYRPKPDDLPLMVQLLQENFGKKVKFESKSFIKVKNQAQQNKQ